MTAALSPAEMAFYQRQMILPGWGVAGQERLKASRVLVIGAGGTGAPVLQYLAAAGIGTIGIADGDFVEMSNLHRQVIFSIEDVDSPKPTGATRRLTKSNPHIHFVEHRFSVNRQNVEALIADYDVVADCTDNFATRDIVHVACLEQHKAMISSAAQMMDGTVTTFAAFRGEGHPCFRCLYPEALRPSLTPSCSQIGVAGPVLAVVGGVQAMEIIKEILGEGNSLSGSVLIYDAFAGTIDRVALQKRPDCPVCGRFTGLETIAPLTHP